MTYLKSVIVWFTWNNMCKALSTQCLVVGAGEQQRGMVKSMALRARLSGFTTQHNHLLAV